MFSSISALVCPRRGGESYQPHLPFGQGGTPVPAQNTAHASPASAPWSPSWSITWSLYECPEMSPASNRSSAPNAARPPLPPPHSHRERPWQEFIASGGTGSAPVPRLHPLSGDGSAELGAPTLPPPS